MGLLEDVARTARQPRRGAEATEALADADLDGNGTTAARAPRKTFAQAAWQIVIADVSMSLDNVLAVAGAAMDHPDRADHRPRAVDRADGVRSDVRCPSPARYRWIAYIGLVIILWVAVKMLLDGAVQQFPEQFSFLSAWFGPGEGGGH